MSSDNFWEDDAGPSLPASGGFWEEDSAPTPPPAPSQYSLPTSLDDALTRVKQGGLFRTPKQPGVQEDGTIISDDGDAIGANGTIDFSKRPAREGPMPAPLGMGAAAVDAASSGASSTLGSIAKGVAKDVMGKASNFAPNTLNAMKAALPSLGNVVGTTANAVAQVGAAGAQAVEAAYRNSPKQGAIAHYLTSQRDPEYAASLQKKEGK